MVNESQLAESKSIHKQTGNTFYYATRLLPERIREATYVLYGFFRVADEVVDGEQDLTPGQQREQLERIRDATLGRRETEAPVLSAFSEVRERYGIPDEEVNLFIDAMLSDIEKRYYETHEELEEYIRGSAAAVGVMMTYVTNPDDIEAALPYARKLGKAFQLTNFIRDVGEDAEELGRVYIPRETLTAHGASIRDVEDLNPTENVRRSIEWELQQTERLYEEAVSGIASLPADCQFSVLLAAVLYADHHRLIRAQSYDTLTETPSLSTARKIALLVRTRWKWFWTDDPEAVFADIAPISSSTTLDTNARAPQGPSPD